LRGAGRQADGEMVARIRSWGQCSAQSPLLD
jgi:hypothetical protein